ncbi:MAG TPA: hypothetical protein VI028_02175 [Solirubrobacterales bacterium]
MIPTPHLPHKLTPLVAFNADHEHLQVRDAQIPGPKARQRVELKASRMLSTVWGPASSSAIRARESTITVVGRPMTP